MVMHSLNIDPQYFVVQPMGIWHRPGFKPGKMIFFHPLNTTSKSIVRPMSPYSCPVELMVMSPIGHDNGPWVMCVGKEDHAAQFPWSWAHSKSAHDSVAIVKVLHPQLPPGSFSFPSDIHQLPLPPSPFQHSSFVQENYFFRFGFHWLNWFGGFGLVDFVWWRGREKIKNHQLSFFLIQNHFLLFCLILSFFKVFFRFET